jgi:predicted house-cleaning noncanonical NTP pyrophosphatase (MazG superfamily)
MAKLVRDRVPEFLQQRALLAKFKEETAEFLDNPNEVELSDILELLDEIVKQMGEDQIRELRAKKAAEKGTFSKRIILDRDDGAA